MAENDRARVPAGYRNGGQFAPEDHPAAGLVSDVASVGEYSEAEASVRSPGRMAYDGIEVDSPGRMYDWANGVEDELQSIAAWNYAHKDSVFEPGMEAYHLGNPSWVTPEQMKAVVRDDPLALDRYLVTINGWLAWGERDGNGDTAKEREAFDHWDDATWWAEQSEQMFDSDDGVPDEGSYFTELDPDEIDLGDYDECYSDSPERLAETARRFNLKY